jgi:hypothetical protein
LSVNDSDHVWYREKAPLEVGSLLGTDLLTELEDSIAERRSRDTEGSRSGGDRAVVLGDDGQEGSLVALKARAVEAVEPQIF